MDRLAENQYKLDIAKAKMKRIGFRYDHELDDYIYKFTVYRYSNIPLIFCKLGVDGETQMVWFNVYDANDALYSPYYDREYGNNVIIHQIEDAISTELIKLGATKVN